MLWTHRPGRSVQRWGHHVGRRATTSRAIRGDRRLVEVPGSGRSPTARPPSDSVAWRPASPGRRPGDRVVLALPNGYDQLLASMAVARAGGSPSPSTPRCGPRRSSTSSPTPARPSWWALGDSTVTRRCRLRARRPAGPRSRSPPSSTRPGRRADRRASSSRTAAWWVNWGWSRSGRRACSATSWSWPCPWPTSWGSPCCWPPRPRGAGVLLPRFDAVAVLDAIESRRATCSSGCRPCTACSSRPAPRAGTCAASGCSGRAPMSCPPTCPVGFSAWARRPRCRGSASPSAQAAFVEGYGMVETGGAVALRVSPPGASLTVPWLGHGLGIPLPGYHLRVVDEQASRSASGRSGSWW